MLINTFNVHVANKLESCWQCFIILIFRSPLLHAPVTQEWLNRKQAEFPTKWKYSHSEKTLITNIILTVWSQKCLGVWHMENWKKKQRYHLENRIWLNLKETKIKNICLVWPKTCKWDGLGVSQIKAGSLKLKRSDLYIFHMYTEGVNLYKLNEKWSYRLWVQYLVLHY